MDDKAIPGLFDLCFYEILKKDNDDMTMFSKVIYPLPLWNKLFNAIGCRSKYKNWPQKFLSPQMKLKKLIINFNNSFFDNFLSISHLIDYSTVTYLCIDFKASLYDFEFHFFMQKLNYIITNLSNLENLSIKWTILSSNVDIFTEIFMMVQNIIVTNIKLNSISFQEKDGGTLVDYMRTRGIKQGQYESKNLSFILGSLSSDILKISIIRHFEHSINLNICTKISQRFNNLLVLRIHGLFNSYTEESNLDINCLTLIKSLKELDISVDKSIETPSDINWMNGLSGLITKFMQCLILNKDNIKLSIFDISGIDFIKKDFIIKFIDSYKCLNSLRLCMTEYMISTNHSTSIRKDIDIIDYHTPRGVHQCLKFYKHCPFYIKKILVTFFNQNSNNKYHILEYQLIFRELIKIMKYYYKNSEISLASTACFYNVLTKLLDFKIPFGYVNCFISILLKIARRFLGHIQIVKNILVTFCLEVIICKAGKKEQLNCMKLCFLIILISNTEEGSANLRLSISLCSVIGSRLPVQYTNKIASTTNIVALINIIRTKFNDRTNDTLLHHSLICIWNLTDECPVASSRFIEMGGLIHIFELYFKYEKFPDVETKIFGLLNNVAEVSTIRHLFLRKNIIKIIAQTAEKGQLPACFFACGVLANILISWMNFPNIVEGVDINEIQRIITETIKDIGMTCSQEIVVYRSFSPFIELLNCEIPATVWWAIWAIRHVTKLQKEKYIPFIKNNRSLLEAIKKNFNHPWNCIKFCSTDLFENI